MKIKSKQYAQALFEMTEGKSESEVDGLVLKFVENLKRNGDFRKANEVVKDFSQIYNEKNGIVEAEILSVKKLNEDQLKKVEGFVMDKYLAKEVVLRNKVGENIIGGISIRVGDEVFDASISGQLKELRNCLSK